MVGRSEARKALFGTLDGPCLIRPPFDVEYGTQVGLGAWVFVNSGALPRSADGPS